MTIKWQKKGFIYNSSGEGWAQSHAARTIPLKISEDILRIYFSARDKEDSMGLTFIDVDINAPSKILNINKSKLTPLGDPGLFDDSGITAGSILQEKEHTYIYYTGWSRRRYLTPFALTIGLLELCSKGKYHKTYKGALISQDRFNPYLAAGPYVIKENNRFKMWYCSGYGWAEGENWLEPLYDIHYAESEDGLDWTFKGCVLSKKYYGEVLSAPWIIPTPDGYHMWFSYRGHKTNAEKQYRMGYAFSKDGLSWERNDAINVIQRSQTGWDSETVCYPSFYSHGNKTYMFYSGNHVGRGGMGFAETDRFF